MRPCCSASPPRAGGPASGDRFRVRFLPTEPLLRSDNPSLDVRANVANLVRLMEPHLIEYADQWRIFESPWAPCRDSAYLDPAGHARPAHTESPPA